MSVLCLHFHLLDLLRGLQEGSHVLPIPAVENWNGRADSCPLVRENLDLVCEGTELVLCDLWPTSPQRQGSSERCIPMTERCTAMSTRKSCLPPLHFPTSAFSPCSTTRPATDAKQQLPQSTWPKRRPHHHLRLPSTSCPRHPRHNPLRPLHSSTSSAPLPLPNLLLPPSHTRPPTRNHRLYLPLSLRPKGSLPHHLFRRSVFLHCHRASLHFR